jgi:hypothetical protein
MVLPSDRPLLFGRTRPRSRRCLAAGLGVFLATLALMGLVGGLTRAGLSIPVSGFWLVWTVAFVTVGLPAVQAYRNDGLLISVVLGLPVPLAFYLVLAGFDLVYPSETLLWGIGTALSFGVPAGLLGFLLGAGARRLRDRLSARPPVGA